MNTGNREYNNSYCSGRRLNSETTTKRTGEDIVMHRGEIRYAYKNENEVGSEQSSGRPCVIVSSEHFAKTSGTVCVVYLTTQPKKAYPEHVILSSSSRDSIALCEQIVSVSKLRIGRCYAKVSDEEMKLIDRAMLSGLGLSPTITQSECDSELKEEIIRLVTERNTYKSMYDSLVNRLTKF